MVSAEFAEDIGLAAVAGPAFRRPEIYLAAWHWSCLSVLGRQLDIVQVVAVVCCYTLLALAPASDAAAAVEQDS